MAGDLLAEPRGPGGRGKGAELQAHPGLLPAGDIRPPHSETAPHVTKSHRREGARIGSLQERLARAGAAGVRFLIVNHKSAAAQALHGELELQAPRGVPVYSQRGPRPDIWGLLGGAKDDFLVYDRCGRLTFHIQLPFSALSFPFVEAAVRFSHQKDHCGNCSFYPAQVNGTDQAESAAQSPSLEGGQGSPSKGPGPHRPTLPSGSPPPAQARGPDRSPGEQPPPNPPPHSLELLPHELAVA
ncbi:selenoprotein Pb-like [Antechinus flavipes]|uniref:selenoprotein Pb-like n=1 Tax=Antechinus flavipes TaxID=38775 RepID=UPI002235BC1C|nr:selenoprotein Pb-like [Antechinus flavipes]